MRWANFLHIYQPPTQSKEVVEAISRESYELIIALLDKYPELRLTINFCGSLIELLERYGRVDVIEGLKKHVASGRVELVGSAMYHPILPLVPIEEARRQIELHNEINKKHFGEAYKPKGFFLPEMAYSPSVGKLIKELGFEWVILDQIHASGQVDPNVRHEIKDIGLTVVFRNSKVSKHFPPEYIVSHIEELGDRIVTAHDGELYGHWHKDDQGYYEKALFSSQIKNLTVSEYISGLDTSDFVEVRAASWESTEEELASGVPFALWNEPQNEVHKKLWSLARQAEAIVLAHKQDPHFDMAARSLGRGFASCAWWWGSGRKIGPFSPVSWNPTEIIEGAELILESVRSLKSAKADERLKAEKSFTLLHDLVWENHWKRYNP